MVSKAGLAQKLGLLDVENVPPHQRTPFIMGGYRHSATTAFGVLRTVFTLHNETGNIWTHLVGALYFTWFGWIFATRLVQEYGALVYLEALWVFALILATNFCLLSSVVYHLFRCSSSPGVCQCCHKLDHTGIVTLILTSFLAAVAIGFRCFPWLRLFYLVYSSGVGFALAIAIFRPAWVGNLPRHMIFCVASGVLPAGHFVALASPEHRAFVVPYVISMFGNYGLGALVLVKGWPERRWPGRFDIIGHSHQFWHLFVLAAASSWVNCCFGLLERVAGTTCEEN